MPGYETSWTDERNAKLRRMWRDQQPLVVIAEAMSVNKSTVSKRAAYLGLRSRYAENGDGPARGERGR